MWKIAITTTPLVFFGADASFLKEANQLPKFARHVALSAI